VGGGKWPGGTRGRETEKLLNGTAMHERKSKGTKEGGNDEIIIEVGHRGEGVSDTDQ